MAKEKNGKISKSLILKYLLLFTPLLATPNVKTIHSLAKVHFVFLKDFLDQTLKSFSTKFEPH